MTEGERLEQLLSLAFKSQAEAAKALGSSQPTINRLIRRDKISAFLFAKYSDALKEAGLNPEYIRDENAQMTVDPDVAAIQQIGEELEELKTRAAQVEARLNTLAQ